MLPPPTYTWYPMGSTYPNIYATAAGGSPDFEFDPNCPLRGMDEDTLKVVLGLGLSVVVS